MIKFSTGVVGGSCSLVSDNQYPLALLDLLSKAQRRCLASIFIVDTSGMSAPLDDVIAALEALAWRGLDIRILLGGSRINMPIAETAAGSARVFEDRRVACRWLTSQPRRGSHTKFVVIDDLVLLGSHNWSSGAFRGQHQDTVLVKSADLAALLSGFFNEQWQRAEES
jgi:phosphatidylserine/phosphatidylglycerophosphate/cardiolipin synthase-like enzyme